MTLRTIAVINCLISLWNLGKASSKCDVKRRGEGDLSLTSL